jgi:hypothetical protein
MIARLPLVALCLALAGCLTDGGPKLATTPAAKYGKIVVAVVRLPPEARRTAEARLAADIGGRGAEVILMSSLVGPGEDQTPRELVSKVLQARASAVFVLDPFVFREGGKQVARTVILSGLQDINTTEVVAQPPITYKAALYDVGRVYRVWMNDVNSIEQKGRPYPALAEDAAGEAVVKAINAGVL